MGRLKEQITAKDEVINRYQQHSALVAGSAVHRRYQYDKVGNLTETFDQRFGKTHYSYDPLGRILQAGQETFAFDPAHNILDKGQSAPQQAIKDKGYYDRMMQDKSWSPLKDDPEEAPIQHHANRLMHYEGIDYRYDALGNLSERHLPDGSKQYYLYDSDNQLIKATIEQADGQTETWLYAYDPLGRRLSKTSSNNQITQFLWLGAKLLQEYSSRGTYTYVYSDIGSFEPLAQMFEPIDKAKIYMNYYHTDQIGIVREMTNHIGNLTWYGQYQAWGKLVEEHNIHQVHQPFRLQNQYYDQETGLHYNLMRYYEPNCGRFINQDPIGLAGGTNLYQFAPNTNNWVDIYGLKKCCDEKGFKQSKDIKAFRNDKVIFAGEDDDKYGHYWTELGPEESYGWWPERGVGLWETISGVPGSLNAASSRKGSTEEELKMDPYHGKYKPGVTEEYAVMIPDCMSEEDAKKKLRDFAKNHENHGYKQWSWPRRENCISFQKDMLKNAGFKTKFIKKY